MVNDDQYNDDQSGDIPAKPDDEFNPTDDGLGDELDGAEMDVDKDLLDGDIEE